MKISRSFYLLILNFLSLVAIAEPSLDVQLNQAVEKHVASWAIDIAKANNVRPQYEIGKIDPRLPISSCSEPVIIKFQGNPLKQTRNTISISCKGQAPWKIFTTATIKLTRSVYVSSRTLSRGSQVTINDIKTKELPVNSLRYGYFTDDTKLVGMILKRNTTIDTPFHPNLLKAPMVINKGDEVIISAVSKTFRIKMKGKALSDGKLGQQISIRNVKSKRIIRGTVIARGLVHVVL